MKYPSFLFYSEDFLSGVSDLTFEERGQYITLLCLQHCKGRLSEKLIKINVPGVSSDVLEKFNVDEDGCYFNTRLEEELNKRYKHSENQREKAKKRWGTESGIATANAGDMPLDSDNDNDNGDDSKKEKGGVGEKGKKEEGGEESQPWPTFEDFWEEYDKKIDRPKAFQKWKKVVQKDREAIMAYIPGYKQAQPDKQFRKNPAVFLNNRSWENELVISGKDPPKEVSYERIHRRMSNFEEYFNHEHT